MQRFAVVLLSSAVCVSADEGAHAEPHHMEEMAKVLPATGLDLIKMEKYGQDQPFWTNASYGVDSMTDSDGNTKDVFHWSSSMFANPAMSTKAGNFEDYTFGTIMTFGNSEGESPVVVDGVATEKKTLNPPTKTQNVVCAIKYHHKKEMNIEEPEIVQPAVAPEEEAEAAADAPEAEGRRLMEMDGCPTSGNMHCNLNKDDENVTFAQWCSDTMKGEWPAVPNATNEMAGNASQANTVACNPWEKSTLDTTSKDGLHMHMAEGKKIYARCSFKQDFEVTKAKQGNVQNFQNLEIDTDYWVFGTTAIYNKKGNLVDTRSSGWKKMRVQREAGANFNAVVSFAGIVAGAALLSF